MNLKQLPADFQPPDNLAVRIWYDTEHRQLCFDGFMSKAAYDKLKQVSQEGFYQSALDELFRICVPEETDHASPMAAMVLGSIGVAALCGLALLLVIR